MNWRPVSGPAAARERAALLGRVRGYFEAAGVLAVDTPAIGATTVSDPNIDSIALADGQFLQTSPEYFMKRLLAGGYPDIYSIGRVYRAAETGAMHQPEFTMIEWYRLGFGLDAIIGDTLGLLAAALERADVEARAERLSYREAFRQAAGIDPIEADVAALARACDADDRLAATIGDSRQAWLDLLFATRVSRSFATDRATVITHFPAAQAALARLSPDDPSVAERFEVFWGDVELANGYVELTDAAEQRRRFEADQAERSRRGRPVHDIDERLLAALATGLPDCAGVALGAERLHMLASGADNIRDVLTFESGH